MRDQENPIDKKKNVKGSCWNSENDMCGLNFAKFVDFTISFMIDIVCEYA